MSYTPPFRIPLLSAVKEIAKATFPEWKGRKVRVQCHEQVTFRDVNWSGGTKSTYAACSLADPTANISLEYMGKPAPWNNPWEGRSAPIPEGVVVVEHSYFCGKDMGLILHVNPNNLQPWLTLSQPEAGVGPTEPSLRDAQQYLADKLGK